MKKIVILISLILVFALIVFNYNKTQKKDIQISFYSWENSFEEQNINEKLYIKVLDINFSTKLELLKTNIKEPPKNFIPVIYITNETMKNVDYSNEYFGNVGENSDYYENSSQYENPSKKTPLPVFNFNIGFCF